MTRCGVRGVELEGTANLRDIGGYPTMDGQATRWRTVYRSGSLDELSADDVERVCRLGIRTLIDLRRDGEGTAEPGWIRSTDVEVVRLPSANPASSALALGVYDAVGLYLADLDGRGHDFAELLSVVSHPGRLPALVQCSGGKDRTGMMIGLLLCLLGVDDVVVAEDYALSDEFRTRDPDGFALASDRVAAAGLDPEVLRTRPTTMIGFLNGIGARHGSVRAFVGAAGVSAHTVDRVRSNLLEPFQNSA